MILFTDYSLILTLETHTTRVNFRDITHFKASTPSKPSIYSIIIRLRAEKNLRHYNMSD